MCKFFRLFQTCKTHTSFMYDQLWAYLLLLVKQYIHALQTQLFWGKSRFQKPLERSSVRLPMGRRSGRRGPGRACSSVKSTQAPGHLFQGAVTSMHPDIPQGGEAGRGLHGPALFSHYSSLRDLRRQITPKNTKTSCACLAPSMW